MATIAELYNKLPTLGEADERFTGREEVFAKATALLAAYDFAFGLCLIHTHCKLAEGEIMVGKGDISQPETLDGPNEYFPERWLATGQPYEFTMRPTINPPPALVEALNQLAGHLGVVGLYHIDKDQGPSKLLEYTEGRKNILTPYTQADEAHKATQIITAWDLASFDPITMTCSQTINCDIRTTRSGKANKHKGTQTTEHKKLS